MQAKAGGMLVRRVMAVMWLAAGLAVSAPGKAPGAQRTCTGVVTQAEGESLTLDLGKRGLRELRLTGETKVFADRVLEAGGMEAGVLVQITGRGQEDRVYVRRLLVLPAAEILREAKQGRSGPVFGATPKSTSFKARLVSTQPWRGRNRFGQEVALILSEETRLEKRETVQASALRPGQKVRVDYREAGKDDAQALAVVILTAAGEQVAGR